MVALAVRYFLLGDFDVMAKTKNIEPAKSEKYSDLLKDPRWQRLRLEVMQRDDFTCQSCKSKDKTLQVHHKKYVFNQKPWEYSTEELITYCEDCHSDIELYIKSINDIIRGTIGARKLADMMMINYFLQNMSHGEIDRTLIYLATNTDPYNGLVDSTGLLNEFILEHSGRAIIKEIKLCSNYNDPKK